jgi:hypothetical protein
MLSPSTTPGKLRLLVLGLIALSLAWGGVAAWVVGQHASAAADVVSTSEPLSLTAQQMYQKLADADVTATTAFLGGPAEPLKDRQRYASDIATAAADLSQLKAASGGDSQLGASLAAVSAALPLYTGYVSQAQTSSSLGYPLTGGSFIQVASEEMHLTLLPAADSVYADENARLAADSAQASGLPWIAVLIVGAIVVGFAFYRGQRWLFRRTRRVVNTGLVAASVALVVGTLWLAVAYGIARGDMARATGHGSAPAETLAQAGIAVQQDRGYQVLNLISRSGASSFTEDFQAASKQVGPGSGSLLDRAAGSSAGDPGASRIAAAVGDVKAWYQVNNQVQSLDKAANYAAETALVTGTGAGQSGSGFDRVEADLGQAISDSQVIFHNSATAGDDAYTGLQIGVIVVALLMAGATAWGLDRRLAEYR